MDIIFHNAEYNRLFQTKTDLVFKINKFSQNKYFVKILKIQDNINILKSFPIVVEQSKPVLLTKKKIIKKLMHFENNIDCSFIRCVFDKDKLEKKGLTKVIIHHDTKNLEKRKIKIEKFFYSCFDEQEQRIAVKKIENILKVSMYDPNSTLCQNIMKRHFNQ